MCRFKSGVILKNRVVIAPGENDSHSDLLESLGIEDDYAGATKKFVRAELIPEDNEWWISLEEHPEKWKFVVDQDIVPDWFDKVEDEKRFREAVCEWWKEHVIVNKEIDKLDNGFYCLKWCKVKKLCNDVRVLLGSSTVGEMWDNSQVGEMYDNSQVGKMYDNSQVGEMRGSSQVSKMWDSSQVGKMYDNSQVGEMRGSSQVSKMYDNSQVGKMYDNSQVGEMRGSSQVSKMWDSSQVSKMYDNSTARDFEGYPSVKIWVSEDGNFEMVVHKSKSEEKTE